MTEPASVLRAKLLITEYGPLFVVLFAIIGAGALGTATWSYTHPPTTTVTDHTERQTVATALETSATVTESNNLYARGTVLRNQPVYLFSATPQATVRLQTNVPEGKAVTVEQRLILVLRAVRDGEVFWSDSKTLASNHERTSDGTASVSTTIDARSLKRRVSAVSNEIGSAGSVEVRLRANVSYETDRYAGHQQEETAVALSEQSYTVSSLSTEKSHSESVTREIVLPNRDATSYTLSGALGAFALLAAAAVAVAYSRRDEWTDLERQLHRARYADWISTGEIPPAVGERRISVRSLEDLVDVGIDANKRVIRDPSRNVYAVVDSEVVYYYADVGRWDVQRTEDPLADAESDEFIWDSDAAESQD